MDLQIPFENSYIKLPERFYAKVEPQKAARPKLFAWNTELAQELGIRFDERDDSAKADVFSGNLVPEGAQPIALAYAGHQFGNFVPQLGDGRAHLLGEVIDRSGVRQDIQLKGSGETPFSRRGDGRSALGPVVREYMLSEAMHHLGVPTTRALAATTTGETVVRETRVAGGVFTRVAESHIRVGTFEYFAARRDVEALDILLRYAANRHYPDIANDENLPLAFFAAVAARQASLVAHWMSLGFIHGVMNTDNTSVAGITIDFGPCAFMDEYRSDKVFSFIDRNGRYAYANQPPIGKWNLTCLARAMWPLFKLPEEETTKLLTSALDAYDAKFEAEWLMRMRAKMGMASQEPEDHELIKQWMAYLEKESLDYTLSFRGLSDLIEGGPEIGLFPRTAEFNAFFAVWSARLRQQSADLGGLAADMKKFNPLYIPRNHQVERAIDAANQGDFSIFEDMCTVLRTPFSEQSGYETYAFAPQPFERVANTFCGT